jgi:hypothetical protein
LTTPGPRGSSTLAKFKYGIALGRDPRRPQGRADRRARDHTAHPKKDLGQIEFDLFGPDAVDWEAA